MNHGRAPTRMEGMISLKVGNLSYRSTTNDVRRVFCRYGKLGDVYIPKDKNSRLNRGFAFVRFYDKRDAEDALDAMDGRLLDGRELRVQMARYGRPTSPHRSRGSRRRGRSRSRSRSRDRDRRRSYSRSHSRSRSDSKSSRGKSRSRSKSADRQKDSRSKSRD